MGNKRKQARRAARQALKSKSRIVGYEIDTIIVDELASAAPALPPKPKRDTSPIEARNEAQAHYLISLDSKALTFATGEAGCGKTFLATAAMVSAQKQEGLAVFLDHENSFDVGLAVANGLNADEDDGQWVYKQPDTFEESVELIGTILKLVRDEELIPADAPICIVADSLASMVPNSKAEKFDKMAEGTAKDKDQLNMNDNTALARATSANFPTLALWARKYNACIIFLNQVRTKIGVMFGDPTTSPGGDSPKFYASVRIRLGASVMKDGKDKIGQDVGAECIKNKVAPPFGKCSWKFYFDPTRGLDVIESLVEHMLEEGYLPKNASGRVEIGDKKYTKSQIVDMYRDKPLPEIIAALQAIDERRTKEPASAETEEA